MDPDQDLRKSQRKNKGIPATKWTYPVFGEGESDRLDTFKPLEEGKKNSGDTASISSRKSTRETLERTLENRRRLAAMEKAQREAQIQAKSAAAAAEITAAEAQRQREDIESEKEILELEDQLSQLDPEESDHEVEIQDVAFGKHTNVEEWNSNIDKAQVSEGKNNHANIDFDKQMKTGEGQGPDNYHSYQSCTNNAKQQQNEKNDNSPFVHFGRDPMTTHTTFGNNGMDNNSLASILMQMQKNQLDTMKCQSDAMNNQTQALVDALRKSSGNKRPLPIFDGNPEEWNNFFLTFKQTTKEYNINDIDNRQRLQYALKGKALAAVKSLLVHPGNVKQIIETLKLRFGKPEIIILNAIEKIKQFPRIREYQNELLIEYSSLVSNLTSTIINLESINHLYNPILLKELVDKLPEIAKKQYAMDKYRRRDDITIEEFDDWLKMYANILTMISTSVTTDQSIFKKVENRMNPIHRRTAPIFTSTENTNKMTRKPCTACEDNNHHISNCEVFKNSTNNEKWDLVKQKKLCIKCLNFGHIAKHCRRTGTCGENRCKKPHHPLLHYQAGAGVKSNIENVNSEIVTHLKEEKILATSQRVLLKVLPVLLTGKEGTISTYALIDGGATTTLIDEEIAKKIGATGPVEDLNLGWITPGVTTIKSQSVDLKIQGMKTEEFKIYGVRTVANLNLPCQSVNMKKARERWPHIQPIGLKNLVNVKPTILIGDDNAYLGVVEESYEGPKNTPVLSKTRLGFTLHGPTFHFKGYENNIHHNYYLNKEHFTPKADGQSEEYGNSIPLSSVFQKSIVLGPSKETGFLNRNDEKLHELIKSYFSTEEFGVKLPSKTLKSRADQRSFELLQSTTKFLKNENKWETGLLWKKDNVILPDNRDYAFKRMKGIELRCRKDFEFAEKYNNQMINYFEKGYARRLSYKELENYNSRTNYLPHFSVFNANKPEKVRIVFDAAAKFRNKSLNDELLTGPDLLKSLPGILMKFREKPVAYTADIKEMYPQIKIKHEDLSAQRFLWRGPNYDLDPPDCVMERMFFGATCAPTSAQYVKNLNASAFEDIYPEAVKVIHENYYMDDLINCDQTIDEAVEIIKQNIEINKYGGFLLCNFVSNKREVLQSIPENLRAQSTNIKIYNGSQTERVLGLHWNTKEDIFTFKSKLNKIDPALLNGRTPTKRETLKILMSVYDPHGYVANFTVKAKILLQDVWRKGVEWDQEIPQNLVCKWKYWIDALKIIDRVAVPRCLCPEMEKTISKELHIFTDASEKAFSSIAYGRFELPDRVETAIIIAKTRVSPLRPMSIPRLELQGAVMGSRVKQTINSDMRINWDETHLWTDSETVLKWIRSDARNYMPFVAHRISEVLENTNINQWHWVPTKLNVADEATREESKVSFAPTSRWFAGPEFLKLDKHFWPKENTNKTTENENDPEYKNIVTHVKEKNDPIIEFQRFGTYLKLVRMVGWMYRFINNSKNKNNRISTSYLQVNELKLAEVSLLRLVQLDSFGKEIGQLKKNGTVEKGTKIFTLSPILVDGLIKIDGRTKLSPNLKVENKQPIILNNKHGVTKLLVQHYHKLFHHQGQETILNELRQKYWIINGRSAVRLASHECTYCKITKAKRGCQIDGLLPLDRVTRGIRPFETTGIDYFGPYEVTVGRRHEKRYGVMFTCLAIRAVHIEIANSLSTDSCIMVIRRFMSIRGSPTTLISDNGTNFHGAKNEMKKAIRELDNKEINNYCTGKNVTWKFIPPSAPHMGGCWERLIRSIKISLDFTLKSQYPSEEVLRTLMMEAAHVVNSRPITFVSLDPKDEEALTPNHFLIGTSSNVQVPGRFSSNDLILRKQWRRSQALTDQFWTRWTKEYLTTLTSRRKWFNTTKNLTIGDFVFIADGQLPRNTWIRGIVMKIYPGPDGRVRVVDVRTNHGIFKRPVTKLIIPRLDFTEESGPETTEHDEPAVPLDSTDGNEPTVPLPGEAMLLCNQGD